MEGIPSEIYNALKTCLLRCGPFKSKQALEAVFIDSRIHQWKENIPEASDNENRAKDFINHFYDKFNEQQENALVLFLYVLREQKPPTDICYNELTSLITAFEEHLVASHSVTPQKANTLIVSKTGEQANRGKPSGGSLPGAPRWESPFRPSSASRLQGKPS